MIRRALPALLLLAGCTGENVDEAFIAEHGALLARVECRPSSLTGNLGYFDALMFLDGSVMSSGAALSAHGHGFHERSDAGRVHAQVALRGQSYCSGPGDLIKIENGEVLVLHCANPSAPFYEESASLDVDTECTGFNKSLFD